MHHNGLTGDGFRAAAELNVGDAQATGQDLGFIGAHGASECRGVGLVGIGGHGEKSGIGLIGIQFHRTGCAVQTSGLNDGRLRCRSCGDHGGWSHDLTDESHDQAGHADSRTDQNVAHWRSVRSC